MIEVSENISPNWSDVVMIGRDNDSVRQTLIRLCDESNCVSVFCLNPIARNAMPCVNVCVTSLWSPSGSIWVWINIYIYYIRTVLTIQTITSAIWRDKVFPSQLLPIPLSSCDWAATQLAKHPPVTQSLGMIHPGRLPMSIMRRLIDILGIKLVRLNPFWSSFIGHCLCHVEHCSALQSSLNSTHQVFSRRWQTIPQIQMIHRIKQMQ